MIKFWKVVTLKDNYMEYENWVRKWARWCDIGTFQQGKLRQGGVVVDRDCTLGLAASDTQEKLFKKLLNS